MVARSAFIEDGHFLVRCLRYRFRTEKLEIKTMMRLQLRGATVLDIGANKGIYCFWMMRAVGRSGRVIAFEPQPEMRDNIERRKSRYNWRNLRVKNVALSKTDGSMNLFRQRIGDGSATLEIARRRSTDKKLDVQVIRLDALTDANFTNLKFIKCDVEGHELNVFLGGEETIRRHRPVVQFESTVNDPKSRVSFVFSASSDTLACCFCETDTCTTPTPMPFHITSSGWKATGIFYFSRGKPSGPQSRLICRGNSRRPRSTFEVRPCRQGADVDAGSVSALSASHAVEPRRVFRAPANSMLCEKFSSLFLLW
jgi:FkbM family methyltransferase